MMGKLSILIGASAALILPANAELAIGGGVGTTGGIIEGQYKLSDYVSARAGFNYFTYSLDEEYDDIEYDADLDLTNFGAFLDVHPFANSFLISAGGYFGDKEIEGEGRPNGPVEIGDMVYTPAQVGTLRLDAQADDAAPFIGIGYDNTFYSEGNWGFKVVGGAMFSGEPDVELTSQGGEFSGNPVFEAEIEKEEARIREDVEDFKVYPVVQIGFTYRFAS